MLHVGVEAGGSAQLCQVCPPEREEPHEALYVILWDNGSNQVGAGMVRLCVEHVDELLTLLLDALGEP